ncbi:LysR family transcriptional regulator [Paenalcaligenes sp.]|uniref:LysR family transcriptional regulator n=1 Tax=Paenalcaligenes sp. TaxID=1966342 RepID=UPI0026051C83|nr:LysR family transcriptional regulator [Paenalcaligenes sp.]
MQGLENRLPSLNSLRVFEVAARYMSFTQAANELHVTQSAVSHRIKTLEEELGMRLFKRENSKLVLTEEGEQLLPELSNIFYQIRNVIDDVKDKSKKQPLYIVLRPYFAQSWLLPRLPDFWERHPEIDLHLIHSIHAPAFNSSNYDLAIQWTNAPAEDSVAIQLLDGSLTACCSPHLIGDKVLNTNDLYDYVLLDEETPVNWNRWLKQAGLASDSFSKRLSIDDTNVRIQAAIDGAGFMLTCLSLLDQSKKNNKLVAPFSDIKLYNYNYYLVYPKSNILKKQAKVFIDWICSHI